MSISTLCGKAVISVEQDGDRPYVSASILTGLKTDGEWDWASRALVENLADYDWLPNQARNLNHGDSVTLRVSWELSYYHGTWGFDDDDEELVFNSVKLLRRRFGANESRRRKKRLYRSKGT